MEPEVDVDVPVDSELPEVVALGICDCGQPGGKPVQVYLSRRNLLALLNKLDANKRAPGTSRATIVKHDVDNSRYPQSHAEIYVTAVEDVDYYHDRMPGGIRWFGEQPVGAQVH